MAIDTIGTALLFLRDADRSGLELRVAEQHMKGKGRVSNMRDLATEQLAAISRLFSSSVVQEMAKRGRSPMFSRLARQSRLLDFLPPYSCVSALFDEAFALLKREGYRHEYIYKAALTHKILLGIHSLQTASMINEFRVGECKADVAILNGTATVYEIKSERDSLSRLERQVVAYSTVFAKVYVIAAEGHVQTVAKVVPNFVGIMQLNRRYRISTLREADDQPERTSPSAIFDSIRTAEAHIILSSLGVTIPAVPNTRLHSVLREEFVKLSPVQAHAGMVRVLKRTRNLLPLSTLVNQLPRSLQTAALSVPLRKADHERLVAAVNCSLQEAMGWA